jgi:2-dehydro-3-deoxyphosphogluconate aldolase/(4S)-4-hydroxy-2-oxoglutarate aldolase
MNIPKELETAPVVPLVQAEDPEVAVKVSRALAKGGLTVAEVVLRTDRALECLRAVADQVPELVAGAGTVLSSEQARQAIDSGAKFIVSPGLDDGVVKTCQDTNIPVFPGIYTPSEIQHAYNLGLDVVKFFPASIAGGVKGIKALAGVFQTMMFMPTGGISASNLAEYLAIPSVIACGGSWLTPIEAIAAGDFDAMTGLAEEAMQIAREARPA